MAWTQIRSTCTRTFCKKKTQRLVGVLFLELLRALPALSGFTSEKGLSIGCQLSVLLGGYIYYI
jgi:hypothetical protein